MKKRTSLLAHLTGAALFIMFSVDALSQPIPFNNPSFEGNCGLTGSAAPGWTVCASSPDVQPGCFGVLPAAHQGNTYAGFCTGENIGQTLPQTLNQGSAYTFKVWLRYDSWYGSVDNGGCGDAIGDRARGSAGRLQIWGGNVACTQTELLWESPTMTSEAWSQYTINFTPASNSYNYIMLVQPVSGVSGANILVDDLSAIVNVPLTLLSFSAIPSDKGVQINWTTASENNLGSFVIERSVDGNHFEQLSTVSAKGNPDELNNYKYLDPFTAATTTYYRLKQVSIDGGATYSGIKSVIENAKQLSIANLNSSTADGTVTFNLTVPEFSRHEPISVQVLDLYGRQFLAQSENNINAGSNEVLLNMQGLSTGIYLLKVSISNGTAIYERFLKE